ncbi:MAG TPA: response regulator, partial [Mucilaginibacter sp.]|nr:response regulator [Mucilaginibacter sp.]
MKTALVIDDEPELLELLHYYFSQLNYDVISFPDVVTTETVESISPDIIVLDNNLGKKSGATLCLELKNNSKTQHIPVILISGYEGLQKIAKDSHADAHIEKPFDI